MLNLLKYSCHNQSFFFFFNRFSFLSFQDVIVGILCVCLLFPLLFPFLNDFDHFSVTHPLAPIFTIGIPFIMCICYPPVDKWNTARRDTTLLVGVAAGISVGSWLSYQYGLAVESPPTPYGIYLPTLMTVGLSFLRLLVGVPLMLLTGELLRPIVRRIISHILKMDLQDPQIKKMQIYELTDSFIPFLFVAINVTFGIPLIFKLLSIDRPEYYTELLAAPTEWFQQSSTDTPPPQHKSSLSFSPSTNRLEMSFKESMKEFYSGDSYRHKILAFF